MEFETIRQELERSELEALAEMSLFCGVVLSALLLISNRLLLQEANQIPIFVALTVIGIGLAWVVFLRHIKRFNVRGLALACHLLIASLLGFAVFVDPFDNKGVEVIPLFATSLVLVLLCPYKKRGLFFCAAYYNLLLGVSYWEGFRWPAVYGWHVIALGVMLAFRIVYHRWSGLRLESVFYYANPAQPRSLREQG